MGKNKRSIIDTKKQGRKSKKVKTDENSEVVPEAVNVVKFSDDNVQRKEKWVNRERILIFATRGISYLHRHLMKDIERLMPHSKHGNKMERRENLYEVNEMCSLRNCNKCILFDGRRKRDLYMWIANVPNGPSAKFLVESIYTSKELKLTGNCLKGSRPILSFDETFVENPHYKLLKELFTQVFGVPNHHPKSQPFVDHVITFSILDHRIWYRNYQIVSEDGAIAEIGPRFVLNPIKILDGSFCGRTLWENPKYVSPARNRRMMLETKRNKFISRKEQKKVLKENKIELPVDPEDEIYTSNIHHLAKKLIRKEKATK